jgi:hypothetical protein
MHFHFHGPTTLVISGSDQETKSQLKEIRMSQVALAAQLTAAAAAIAALTASINKIGTETQSLLDIIANQPTDTVSPELAAAAAAVTAALAEAQSAAAAVDAKVEDAPAPTPEPEPEPAPAPSEPGAPAPAPEEPPAQA